MADVVPISIFISYARKDSVFVDRLEVDLQSRKYQTWVDRQSLVGGQVWMDELEKAIQQCHVLVVILTPDSVQSRFVRMEYRYAQKLGKVVIPLYQEECELVPIDLNSLQWVNFMASYDQGLHDLLIALNPVHMSDIVQNVPQQFVEVPQQEEEESVEVVFAPPVQSIVMGVTSSSSHIDLYRAGIQAKVKGDMERAVVLWLQILDDDPDFQRGTLAIQVSDLSREITKSRVLYLLGTALMFYVKGKWENAISAFKSFLECSDADIFTLYDDFLIENRLSELPSYLKCSWALTHAFESYRSVYPDPTVLSPFEFSKFTKFNDRFDGIRYLIVDMLNNAEKHLPYEWMYENACFFEGQGDHVAALEQLKLLEKYDSGYGDPLRIFVDK